MLVVLADATSTLVTLMQLELKDKLARVEQMEKLRGPLEEPQRQAAP